MRVVVCTSTFSLCNGTFNLARTYTVTFEKNDGSGDNAGTRTVTYDAKYGTLPTLSRTGYTFTGWFTAASGGTQVTSATKVTQAKDHTLYAQWKM